MEPEGSVKTITVTIYREGNRREKVDIPIELHLTHSQSAWRHFMHRVSRDLGLEVIDGIYDDFDGSPVIRAASLVDGGLYFARPTENCALLRSLTREEQERYPAWPSIDEGNKAKLDLAESIQEWGHQESIMPTPQESGKTKPGTPAGSMEGQEGSGRPAPAPKCMCVKQGFKCPVFATPDLSPPEVATLGMGEVVMVTSEWGEAFESHSARGKGKVARIYSPKDGFVERRRLEKAEGGSVPAGQELTPLERMQLVHKAASAQETLQALLQKGSYFRGTRNIHQDVDVHRAALRGMATLARTCSATRETLLADGGVDLIILVINRFLEDPGVCEFGCWALAAFAGDCDEDGKDEPFQSHLATRGGLQAAVNILTAHPDSQLLRHEGLLVGLATVQGNPETTEQARLLGFHRHAQEGVRRWLDDTRLVNLACWLLHELFGPYTHLLQMSLGDSHAAAAAGGPAQARDIATADYYSEGVTGGPGWLGAAQKQQHEEPGECKDHRQADMSTSSATPQSHPDGEYHTPAGVEVTAGGPLLASVRGVPPAAEGGAGAATTPPQEAGDRPNHASAAAITEGDWREAVRLAEAARVRHHENEEVRGVAAALVTLLTGDGGGDGGGGAHGPDGRAPQAGGRLPMSLRAVARATLREGEAIGAL